MASSSKRKKQAFPILTAHQISFEQQPPQPYYNPNEQAQLGQYQNQYQVRPKQHAAKPAADAHESSDTEPSIATDEEDEKERTAPHHKPSPNTNAQTAHHAHTHDDDDHDGKEEKGLLSKIAEKAKEAVGIKEAPKLKNTKVTIELPRDVLTAFFLLRLPRDKSRGIDPKSLKRGEQYPLPAYWEDYALYGKVCLWLSVLIPYGIQWYVLCTLLGELADNWEEFSTLNNNDPWFNTTAFSVLFLYMWKDLASFYYSVWYYIKYLQEKSGGITKNLTHAASAGAEITKQATKTHVADVSHVSVAEVATEAVEEVKTAIKFIEFRLWLISVIVLYVGLTCYSLLSIPLAETLVDKLEVSLSIFFILEVDDWAYELFIAQANILDDAEFDVQIIVKKDRKGVVKRQQKQLAVTLILLGSSVFACWLVSFAINNRFG
mmetsp:Transcript_22511/g.36012  ORF Transcript_22511/g.36012 Transcript_22511/m.36012 type:complete len:433 (+) Transcript_22511:28-1326(+)